MNLARILANVLDVNTARNILTAFELQTERKHRPAMYELQIVSQVGHAGIRGEHKSERREKRNSE